MLRIVTYMPPTSVLQTGTHDHLAGILWFVCTTLQYPPVLIKRKWNRLMQYGAVCPHSHAILPSSLLLSRGGVSVSKD